MRNPLVAAAQRLLHGSKSEPKSTQRADIQGLRALAVGAVILDHAAIPGFTGGFTGVDVFFVISGFLITGLLLGDLAKHARIRFMNFYARRAARILPAASVVIAATAVASAMILGVLGARSVMGDSLWAVFFAANIHFASVGTNYFAATSSTTSPLEHYWSLAVEEQFYLVWPALLALLALVFRTHRGHVPRVPIAAVLGLIVAGSLWLSVVSTASNPTSAYFSTLDRVWELGLGALLAVALPLLAKIPAALRAVASWTGLAAIIAAALVYNSSTAIPGWKALLPVLGSAFVLVGGIGAPRAGVHRILSIRPLRFVGDISYSLYLWHFPILILGAAYLGARDTLPVRIALIGAAVVLSTVSYYGLENPLRHAAILLKRAWHGLVLWPLATGMVALVTFAAQPTTSFAAATAPVAHVTVHTAIEKAIAAAQSNDPVPHRTTPSLLVAPTDEENLGSCSAYLHLTSRICQYGDPNGKNTLVVFGNSHSVMWVPALAGAAKAAHWKFYPVVKEACGYDAYSDVTPGLSPNNQCTQWYDWAKVQIARLHPDVIVIGSYTQTPDWYKGEVAVVHDLKALAPRVVLFGDTPKIPEPAGCLLKPGATQGSCLWPLTAARVQLTDQAHAIATAAHIQFLDVTPWFCANALCPSLINDVVPYKDGAHVTPQYSAYLVPAMITALGLSRGTVLQP